ncbi:MAG: TetR-like C-terminal domain-containing protein [Eubacteriales bacterium]|nr:TetR-like C-terminal domain-containing protein [Eubacteriales bacterium]
MASDRRVKYTKMVLRESLIKLLRDKPISRITIKELCETADINRATFYSHYSDQFDLLKKIENEFIENITSYLQNFEPEAKENDLQLIVLKIFEYIAENKDLCRVLLGENGDMDFQNEIMKVVSERIVFEWQKKKGIDENMVGYIYTFVATGSIGVIRKWLLEENSDPPARIAALVSQLANKGVRAYI